MEGPTRTQLARAVGVPGAVLLGLGSILGAGIFVSVGVAAEVAGAAVVPAVALAAGVATLNGLSSAQLAASHPVSGGTYEYGYRYLSPTAGFLAGWMFLCAKSASAATAALGFGGYALAVAGAPGARGRVALGVAAVAAVTALVAGGMRRSNRANAAIVSVVVASLLAFVACGLPAAVGAATRASFLPAVDGGAASFLHATALLFVAYTGYGRVATLGEEVRDPARSIPRAIGITLLVSTALYAVVAHGFGVPGLAGVVALGALVAMVGVLLNLVLGLSRVWLAMGRRGDAPRALAHLDARGSPRPAVLLTGAVVGGLVLVGDVRATWSFSAFSVLVYYALTNLAALRLPPEARRYPRALAAAGLLACLSLAFFVDPRVSTLALALAAAGLGGRSLLLRYSPRGGRS